MRVLFVRHGQMAIRASAASDADAIDRLFNQEEQGHLTDRGRREAAQVAQRLRSLRIDGLYSSHLHRARETGEVVSEVIGLPLVVTERVSEIKVGALHPRSRGAAFVRLVTGSRLPTQIKGGLLGATLTPLYFRSWRAGRTVGGESASDFERRIASFLQQLERDHPPDATVAVVAHGYLITTLTIRSGLRGRLRVMRRPYIPNGAICEMELRDARLRSIRHADGAHLRT